ncbi:MAG: hypothetical protein Q4D38_02545, partial [Planctomycetia bacterium]|nr:hypothetical protein [Planctomycetia bacterium]
MSTFRTFRKNKKTWLATLGVLAMFAFVFIPVLQQGGGLTHAGRKSVVTTKLFGNLNEYELIEARNQYICARSFFMNLYQEFSSRAESLRKEKMNDFLKAQNIKQEDLFVQTQYGPQIKPEYQTALQIAMMGDASVMQMQQILYALQSKLAMFGGFNQELGESQIIHYWLAARFAERMGIEVPDEEIGRYVSELLQGAFTRELYQSVVDNMHTQSKTIDESLREYILFEMYLTAMMGEQEAAPSQMWNAFCKANRQAQAQAYVVAAADFLDKAPEPSSNDLTKFFDEYKDRDPQLHSGTPGFKQPRKVAVQYIAFDTAAFERPEEVTEEEILQYYNENRSRFVKPAANVPSTIPSASDFNIMFPTDATGPTDATIPPITEPLPELLIPGEAEGTLEEVPAEVPLETPAEIPAEVPAETPVETPAEVPAEVPA